MFGLAILAAGLGWAACGAQAQAILDTRPAFMQIITNYTFQTNAVIVTNYVVVTNALVKTNLYNAQGQLLLPVESSKPPIPGLIPIAQAKPEVKTEVKPEVKKTAPDPAVVKAQQLQAVRDLLTQGLFASSNKVAAPGSFSSNITQQIQIPTGVTSFDRRKSQALMTAMNLAAEKAAPGAIALLSQTAARFQTDDPAAIVSGNTAAATRSFVATHGQEMQPRLLSLVQQAGLDTNLRDAYSSVMVRGGGLLGSVLGAGPAVDIESHVAQGLWKAITNQWASQEVVIRADPAARGTAALKEVFKN